MGAPTEYLSIYQQNEVRVTTEDMDAKSGRDTPPGDIGVAVGVSFAVNGSPPRHGDDVSPTGETDLGTTTTVGRGHWDERSIE
jgi:hypothetical protein